MRAILHPAARHGKSSRGTPRLRLLPRPLHGAVRLAAWTTRVGYWSRFVASAQDAQTGLTFSLIHPSAELLARSAPLHPLAASGGVLVTLDWPALTAALTEIRLFDLLDCLAASSYGTTLSWNSCLGRVVAVWCTALRAADSAGAPQAVLVLPNVRAKLAPTVGRQARTGENVPRTARPGLVARRWGSA